MKTHFLFTILGLMTTSYTLCSMNIDCKEAEANTLSDATVLARMGKYLKEELIMLPQEKSEIVDHGYMYIKPESTCIHLITYKLGQDKPFGVFLKHRLHNNGSVETSFYLSSNWNVQFEQRRIIKRFWQNIPGQLISAASNPNLWYEIKKTG